MSLVKTEEINDAVIEKSKADTELVQCCDKHVLINPTISINNRNTVSYMDLLDLNSDIELQQMRILAGEQEKAIANLQQENLFLRTQVTKLNDLLEQLSTSLRNLGTRNDIRIKVENASNLTFKKWYSRPKVVLTGSAIAILFSIYLRYKIKS
ncbi:hypothetical protein ABEB36_014615 [Hypothenemus hampei]|uniref:Uncharacterized protein n=1 Tax=Hypothenemus hampei TaxID=57062 RepID=A0ABD1E2K7_HYPHA